MHEYENFQITIVGAKPNYDDDGNVFYISVVIVERRGHPRQVQSFMTEEPYVPIKKAKKYGSSGLSVLN